MDKVICEKHDRIAYITLNRPKALNALDDELNKQRWNIWYDFNDDSKASRRFVVPGKQS